MFHDDDGVPSPRLRVRDLVDHEDNEYLSEDEGSELSELEDGPEGGEGGGAGMSRRDWDLEGERDELEEEGDEGEVEVEGNGLRGIDDDELEAYVDEMEVYSGEIDDIDE